ncbi:hypothetical protein BHM03_00059839 [Ensete ventricosum]|nr:hypothetical protein BHM03_00059839 [Ensete ventricosum]
MWPARSQSMCKEIRQRDRESHWEHTERSSEEDRKTHRKNARGCRIGRMSGGTIAATQVFKRLTRPYLGIYVLSAVDLPKLAGELPVPRFFEYGFDLNPKKIGSGHR